jgi:secondary thiamine-phosphate synthase enzyme
MKSVVKTIGIHTTQDMEIINITDIVKDAVTSSGLTAGTVHIMTKHTTSGITVNEGLPDIEDDLLEMLHRLVPRNHDYRHARFLHSDGQMAVNGYSHLRSALIGKDTFFPLHDGEMVMGSRQTIYFVEMDGPLQREFLIHVLGE